MLRSAAVLPTFRCSVRWLAPLLLLASAAVAAPAPVVPPAPATEAPATLRDRIVAVVDGDPILDSDVERALVLSGSPPANGAGAAAQRRKVLDGLVEERLRIHEVERYGFEQVPVELIARHVEQIRARFASEEELQRRLRDLGMTQEGLEQLVAQQLQVLVYVDELLGARVFVGLEEIEAYYQETLAPRLRAEGKPVPPLDDVREEIREVLRQQRLNEELLRWTADLRRRADVQDFFDRPQRELPPKVGSRP